MKALIKTIGIGVILITLLSSTSSCSRGYGCPGHISKKEKSTIIEYSVQQLELNSDYKPVDISS